MFKVKSLGAYVRNFGVNVSTKFRKEKEEDIYFLKGIQVDLRLCRLCVCLLKKLTPIFLK